MGVRLHRSGASHPQQALEPAAAAGSVRLRLRRVPVPVSRIVHVFDCLFFPSHASDLTTRSAAFTFAAEPNEEGRKWRMERDRHRGVRGRTGADQTKVEEGSGNLPNEKILNEIETID